MVHEGDVALLACFVIDLACLNVMDPSLLYWLVRREVQSSRLIVKSSLSASRVG